MQKPERKGAVNVAVVADGNVDEAEFTRILNNAQGRLDNGADPLWQQTAGWSL